MRSEPPPDLGAAAASVLRARPAGHQHENGLPPLPLDATRPLDLAMGHSSHVACADDHVAGAAGSSGAHVPGGAAGRLAGSLRERLDGTALKSLEGFTPRPPPPRWVNGRKQAHDCDGLECSVWQESLWMSRCAKRVRRDGAC